MPPSIGPDIWLSVGRPEYLKQEVLMSMRRLRVDRIDLWQLHRIDPKVPHDEQFDIMREMEREGLIRHLGLSEVTVSEIAAASKYFPGASPSALGPEGPLGRDPHADGYRRGGRALRPLPALPNTPRAARR